MRTAHKLNNRDIICEAPFYQLPWLCREFCGLDRQSIAASSKADPKGCFPCPSSASEITSLFTIPGILSAGPRLNMLTQCAATPPWQQTYPFRTFPAYDPWAIPFFATTGSERLTKTQAPQIGDQDSKWEGSERTEQMIRDIEVSPRFQVIYPVCEAVCKLIRSNVVEA